jgi:hypothetical protein
VERTPSGRTLAGTRAGDRRRGQEARAASIRARAQHTGLGEQAAADPCASTPEGILALRGAFSAAQGEAVRIYRGSWEGHVAATSGPHLATGGRERGRVWIIGGEAEQEDAHRRYLAARRALEASGRGALEAITLMVERNALPAAAEWPAARRGADALARHYNLHLRTDLADWPPLTRR